MTATLYDFYRRCMAADWQYEYAEGQVYREGRSAMEKLRYSATESAAHQHIFDRVQNYEKNPGTCAQPEFGNTILVTDVRSLDEAIAYHEKQAQGAWDDAKRAEEDSMTDQDAVARYHRHNAITNQLIGQRHTLAAHRSLTE